MTKPEAIHESLVNLRHRVGVLTAMSPNKLLINVNVLDLKNALEAIADLQKFKSETEDELDLLREAVKARTPAKSLTCLRMLPTNVACNEWIPCPHHGSEFAEVPR